MVPDYDPSLDWAANFAQMLGVNNDESFKEAVRPLAQKGEKPTYSSLGPKES